MSRLCDLVRIPNSSVVSFDWNKIENRLGIALPDDYKELAETFPNGRFQGSLRLIKPGEHGYSKIEFLGYYGRRLDDMRQWREEDSSRFPWPIYPEPGGLLPWAVSVRGDLVFWGTDDENPNLWPVIYSDFEFYHWKRVRLSACSFLVSLVTGELESDAVFGQVSGDSPFFVDATQEPVTSGDPRMSGEYYWQRRRKGKSRVANQFGGLSALIDAGELASSARASDWAKDILGIALPRDYVDFIDMFGPGRLADVNIVEPPKIAELSLIKSAKLERVSPPSMALPPFYPESGGLVPWGYTDDGWVCYWAPTDADPNDWGVVVSSPDMLMFKYHHTLSFSSFLLDYGKPGNSLRMFPGREVEPDLPFVFTPRFRID